MLIKKWNKLPLEMQIDEVKPYYEKLRKKNFSLFWVRFFDILISFIMLLLLLPFFLILAIAIVIDSRGPVFYRQVRVTQYGKKFKIFKFRTMVKDADKKGTLVTVGNDARITRVGKFIRKLRLDEVSQLIDVFRGTMSFVGTRPEVPKYVDKYQKEYLATLLLPAGVTSLGAIKFKDEDALLEGKEDTDKAYIEEVLPKKMEYNLEELPKIGLFHNIKIMFMTVGAVFGGKKKKKEKAE